VAEDLCYLDAKCVESPAGSLAGLALCSRDDETIGHVEAVLIDPVRRRVRYFVVKSPGFLRRQRYLLPMPERLRIDEDRRVIRVDAPAAEVPRHEFDAKAVRPFTDDDAITAMFAPHAA
jgi:hypothetical protein